MKDFLTCHTGKVQILQRGLRMTNAQHQVRVMETFRSIFYTPIYASISGGFWETAGIDVTFSTTPTEYPHPLSAINHGAADIVQSGIMRSIIAADWGAEAVPIHFAKINARDGFFVLSRHLSKQFAWEDLKGSTLIPVGFSPMPWASLQSALKKHLIQPTELRLLQGLSLTEAISAFTEGEADYIHLPEPYAGQLIHQGIGHLVISLGKENGHIAYSSFAAGTKFIEQKVDVLDRFMSGYSKALEWLSSTGPEEISEAVAPFFDKIPTSQIVDAITRYKSQDTWSSTPDLNEPEYQGLQDILLNAGMVIERQPYHKVVTTRFFQSP